MSQTMDFYFDFVSPYGYLAAMKIEALAAQYKRTIAWHPLLLGAIFKTTGAVPLVVVPIKGDYIKHEVPRTARFHGIPFHFPSEFPIATQAAARATYYIRDKLQDQHGQAAVSQFVKAVYQAYFVNDIHSGKPENVVHIAVDCGFDGAAVAQAIQTDEYKAILKQETEQAMARGVFGSPFVIVSANEGAGSGSDSGNASPTESFWGFDHFYQIDAFLKNGKI